LLEGVSGGFSLSVSIFRKTWVSCLASELGVVLLLSCYISLIVHPVFFSRPPELLSICFLPVLVIPCFHAKEKAQQHTANSHLWAVVAWIH
jgi:hypothetical protein